MRLNPVRDPDPKHPDPVDPDKSDMLPYGRHAGQQLSSTQGSATQLTRGGMRRDNKYYNPFKKRTR